MDNTPDRPTEQILHRYLAALRQRQELAEVERDPDVVTEARELEAVAWRALQMVWTGEWFEEGAKADRSRAPSGPLPRKGGAPCAAGLIPRSVGWADRHTRRPVQTRKVPASCSAGHGAQGAA